MRLSLRLLIIATCLGPLAAAAEAAPLAGNPRNGARLIAQVGCGSCHVIPGIPGARGLAGPPLDFMSKRIFIAGLLRNTPANMMRWLMDPQAIVPGNAMPRMGLNEDQARDITAYLSTLR